jgi:DNA gyrase inhibitor GyrI
LLEAEIIDLPEQHLEGLYGKDFEQHTYFNVAQRLYQEIAGHLGLKNGFDFNKHHLIGISLESPWRTEQTESKFFAGPKPDNDIEIDHANLDGHILPAGNWARFEHKGAYNTMWQTILSTYANWVEQSNRKLRNCAIVQHYVDDINCTPIEDLLTHIYLPIED